MRAWLLRYLVCPACGQDLALTDGRPSGADWTEEGVLACRGCSSRYPIRRGIPRFPVADRTRWGAATVRTQRAYNFTWDRVGAAEIEQRWEKDSYGYGAVIPSALLSGEGRVGLDAGCGGGADLLRVASGGAELIGVDISTGVDSAMRTTRHLPNVHLVQADLNALPFRPATLDFIYSFGVLHHLPEPSRALDGLARLLRPGAPLVTYLYEDFSDRSALERGLLAGVRAVRSVTSRLPARVLYAGCWLTVPVIWLCCSVPASLLRRIRPAYAERIPFRHSLRWPVLASDLFDRFAPPLERRSSREGVHRLYARAGLEGTEIRRRRGWVSWGFTQASRHEQTAHSAC